MGQFVTVLITVISLFVLAIPGFILAKTKLLNKTAESVLSAIVLYGAQPMLVFMSFQKQYDSSIVINMLVVAVCALVVHLLMIALMFLVIKNKGNDAKKNCVRFASIFSNCGYMGLPFLKMLFGDSNSEVLIYAAVIIAVFNLVSWSLGQYIITGDRKQMSIKKALLNPTTIGIFVGAILFFTIQTPIVDLAQGTAVQGFVEKLMASLDTIGNLVTPLSMMLIGVKLAGVNVKSLFTDKWAYVSCFFKLIVMGVLTMLVMAFLSVPAIVKYAVLFTLSMPSATSTVLFSVQFGGDSQTASVCVLLSTILSAVTIPIMFIIFNQLFGIPLVI